MLSFRNNSNKQLLHCICLEYLFDLSQKCFTTYSLCDKLHFSLSLSLSLFLIQTIVALTFAHYAAKPFFEDCDPPQNAVKLLAAVCLCK